MLDYILIRMEELTQNPKAFIVCYSMVASLELFEKCNLPFTTPVLEHQYILHTVNHRHVIVICLQAGHCSILHTSGYRLKLIFLRIIPSMSLPFEFTWVIQVYHTLHSVWGYMLIVHRNIGS